MDSSKFSPILYKPSLKTLPIVFLLESEFFEDRLSSSFPKFYIPYCLLHRTGQVAGIQVNSEGEWFVLLFIPPRKSDNKCFLNWVENSPDYFPEPCARGGLGGGVWEQKIVLIVYPGWRIYLLLWGLCLNMLAFSLPHRCPMVTLGSCPT